MRVVCDKDLCVGCLACVVTCLDHHYGGEEEDATPLRRYKKYTSPLGLTKYTTYSCYHCKKPACVDACPVSAISVENGIVNIDRDVCIGCGSCVEACPFDIPVIDKENKMVKCDLCGGDPYCVKICPMKALKLV